MPTTRQSIVERILDIAKQNLAPDMITAATVSCCNNACWAAGELAIRMRGRARCNRTLKRVCGIFGGNPRDANGQSKFGRKRGDYARKNLYAVRGRVGVGFAKYRSDVVRCDGRLLDGVEKEHAFKGLCELIKVNPNGGVNCLKEICEAIAS